MDVLLAVVAVVAAVVLHAELVPIGSAVGFRRTALVLAVIHGAAVLGRRWRPAVVLGVQIATAVGYAVIGLPAFMLGPAVLFTVYAAGSTLSLRPSLVLLGFAEVAVGLLIALGPAFPGVSSLVLYAGIIGASWWLGRLIRRWRTAAEEHERRAEELAASREELARYAVADERLRIARELHDVVAHSMTVVAMHAGTGRMVAADDPDAARAALETVERLSREAIAEMRRLVGLLRIAVGPDDDLAPTPGLGDLHRLVGEMVATGVAVEVRTEGPLARVPPGQALAVYRIAQEALTNAARHAGPVKVVLEVKAETDEVVVVVRNEGAPESGGPVGGTTTTSGGAGLLGMRERAELYHGRLEAGPTAGGGWAVEARIPLDGVVR